MTPRLVLGARIRIREDTSIYTRGAYAGCNGDVRQITKIHLTDQPPMTLLFVRVDELPRDDHGLGGWWFTPNEITIL